MEMRRLVANLTVPLDKEALEKSTHSMISKVARKKWHEGG
jgi:hypothetical protein